MPHQGRLGNRARTTTRPAFDRGRSAQPTRGGSPRVPQFTAPGTPGQKVGGPSLGQIKGVPDVGEKFSSARGRFASSQASGKARVASAGARVKNRAGQLNALRSRTR